MAKKSVAAGSVRESYKHTLGQGRVLLQVHPFSQEFRVQVNERIHMILLSEFTDSRKVRITFHVLKIIEAALTHSGTQNSHWRSADRFLVPRSNVDGAMPRTLEFKLREIVWMKSREAIVTLVTAEKNHVTQDLLDFVRLFEQLLAKLRVNAI